jgi:hypothetical protein
VKWQWQVIEYSAKNLYQRHFFHHKSHMDWPAIELGPTSWEGENYPPEPWYVRFRYGVKWKYFSIHLSQISENNVAFWKVPRFRRFGFLVRVACRRRSVRSIGGLRLTGGNKPARRTSCRGATLSITNLTWTDMRCIPCHRGDRPMTNSAAIWGKFI